MISINYENILFILILLFVMYYLFKWFIYTEGFKGMTKTKSLTGGFKSVIKKTKPTTLPVPPKTKSRGGLFKSVIKKTIPTTVPVPPKTKSTGGGGFKSVIKKTIPTTVPVPPTQDEDTSYVFDTTSKYNMSNLENADYNYNDLSKSVVDNIKTGIDESNKQISDISRDTVSKTLGSFDTSKLLEMFPSNIMPSIESTLTSSNDNTVEYETVYNTQIEKDKLRLFGP